MANNNKDIFHQSQIWSYFEWNQDQTKQKRLSANLLNNNGFIVYIKKRKGNGDWTKGVNFWCRQEDMVLLHHVISMTLKDIRNGNFSNKRSLKGKKSNIYFPTKKANDKVYVGIKIVKKKDGKETSDSIMILLGDRRIEGEYEGVLRLIDFRNAIKNNNERLTTTYHQHYKGYFEKLSDKNNSNNNNSGNNSSRDKKPENDDDFPV